MSLDDTVQKAFDQAVEAVGKPLDDTTPAADKSAEGAPAEPPAPETAATTEPEPAPDAEPKPEAPAEEQFFSDEDFEKLKDDPVAVRKAMQKAYTQKTQRIAEQRKLIEALDRDPINTVKYLARVAGLNIADPEQKPAAAAKEPASEVKAKLVEVIGEETAEAVLPVVQEIVKATLEQDLEPIRQSHEIQLAERAAKETADTLERFSKKHPDWQKHEAQMMEIAKTFIPRNMTEDQYLERLYVLATADIREADAVKKAAAKLNSSVQAAATSSPDSPAASTKIAPTPQRGKNFDETLELAFKAAVRGERWAQ